MTKEETACIIGCIRSGATIEEIIRATGKKDFEIECLIQVFEKEEKLICNKNKNCVL